MRRLRGTASLPSSDPDHVWSIGILAGNSPVKLRPLGGVRNPVITHQLVNDVPAGFVADPFMLRRSQQWYLFFELWNRDSQKGELAFASSLDGVHWQYGGLVLVESFHLSYPYVFEWNHEVFMIPESRRAGEVRLYRAAEFPARWVLEEVLLEGPDFVDTSVFRYADSWWMYTENSALKHDTLRLFHADRLQGPWIEHRASPIISGNAHVARPAGRVILWQNRVVRLAQDCHPFYGRSLSAFMVTELSADSYQESPLSRSLLSPSGRGWNRCGMHHMDAQEIDGRWWACVDGWYDQNDPDWN